jgi:hypothetical protein
MNDGNVRGGIENLVEQVLVCFSYPIEVRKKKDNKFHVITQPLDANYMFASN